MSVTPREGCGLLLTYLLTLAATLAGAAVALGEAQPAPPPQELLVPDAVFFPRVASDIVLQPPSAQPFQLYLDARCYRPAQRRAAKQIIDGWLNSLSRHDRISRSREVTPWLWAVDLRQYAWPQELRERLGPVNYYHQMPVKVVGLPVTRTVTEEVEEKVPVKRTRRVAVVDRYGRSQGFREEPYDDYEVKKKKVERTVTDANGEKDDFSPLVPTHDYQVIARLTGSRTPIIRADNFLNQTGVQQDRDATKTGYYDFAGNPSKRVEFDAFIGLDRKLAAKHFRERAAIIPVSGVGLFGRQLFTFRTIPGRVWQSVDVENNDANRDPVRNLDDDFKGDAFEYIYSRLNRMPGYHLDNKAGDRQNTAPDKIAANHRSTNNDRRVHVGVICLSCHTDSGLNPFDDWSRRLYDPRLGGRLAILDFDGEVTRRRVSLYIEEITEDYEETRTEFGKAIAKATGGLSGEEFATGVIRLWSGYLDSPVTRAQMAYELGLSEFDFVVHLQKYAASKLEQRLPLDPVIGAYIRADPLPIRREVVEKTFATFKLITQGVYP